MIEVITEVETRAEELSGLRPFDQYMARDKAMGKTIAGSLIRAYGIDAPGHTEEWLDLQALLANSIEPQLAVTHSIGHWSAREPIDELHLFATRSKEGVGVSGFYTGGIKVDLDGVTREIPSSIGASLRVLTSLHVASRLQVPGERRNQMSNGLQRTNNWWSEWTAFEGAKVESSLIIEPTNEIVCSDMRKDIDRFMALARINRIRETFVNKDFDILDLRDRQVPGLIQQDVRYGHSLYRIVLAMKRGVTSVRPKSKGQKNIKARDAHDSLPVQLTQVVDITNRDFSELIDRYTGNITAIAAEDLAFAARILAAQTAVGIKHKDFIVDGSN